MNYLKVEKTNFIQIEEIDDYRNNHQHFGLESLFVWSNVDHFVKFVDSFFPIV